MTNTKHTPTPWKVWDHPVPAGEIHIGAFCTPLIAKVMLRDASMNEFEANAAFIVRACNSHEYLVALLDEALFQLANVRPAAEREKYISLVNKALAKARGEA